MLIIESDNPPRKRMGAPGLLLKIQDMTQRCIDDKAYCMDGLPKDRNPEPPKPVEIKLNKHAMAQIRLSNVMEQLILHEGRTYSANPRLRNESRFEA